ncbi:hypothetical protein SAMN05518672_1011701 [Chitinophaga sp. CF118]|uniref:hypothetical protein n=1 Tax=Chitinophaga sp. CF118 TaxID=1884367 RepID=UPI0008EAD6EA|nr:hypothetical protein [Chitinophaga sp. CF118]SFD33836.1 hypothetical protein SAMN05518672_1011701 [Chitinophaga sp. CF118]
MKKSGLFIMAICLLSLAACTSTRLTSSWKTPDAKLQREQKIMVVALVPKQERKLRVLMEDNLVSELRKEGYNAVSAFATYGPDDALGKGDEKAALNKFRNSEVAQVMTVALVDKSRQKSYTPGYGYPYPYYGGFSPYYYRGWYGGMYGGPGYYQVNVKYQWETNLYDLNEKKLLYNAEINSVDPPTAYRQAYLYAREIVRDLQKQQLIAKN